LKYEAVHTPFIMLDDEMREVQRHLLPGPAYCFTVSDDRIYMHRGDCHVTCHSLPSFANIVERTREAADNGFEGYADLTIANGLLYAIAFRSSYDYWVYDDRETDEVVAFDMYTLEERFRFGANVFASNTDGMAVVGDAVYVGDCRRCSLQVFSLAGAHLREIRGDWGEPDQLVHHEGRLYLQEKPFDTDQEYGGDGVELDVAWFGSRIVVLDTEGRILQIWKTTDDTCVSNTLVFGDRLLVHTKCDEGVTGDALFSLEGI
jgi:hypothetical protein